MKTDEERNREIQKAAAHLNEMLTEVARAGIETKIRTERLLVIGLPETDIVTIELRRVQRLGNA
jgi:hypothetical protein